MESTNRQDERPMFHNDGKLIIIAEAANHDSEDDHS